MADLSILQSPLTAGQHALVSRGETCSSGEQQPATVPQQHVLTAPDVVSALPAAAADAS